MPKIFCHSRIRISAFQTIILGFICVILIGTVLLMLPCSTKENICTSFHDALFTAVSAVCVTGLIVKDTGSYWSTFGQTIIILLIQIGGLGVVTIAVVFAMLSGKKISLMQRSTMQSSISAPKVGGIVRLTRFIVIGTLVIEGIGAVCMAPTFVTQYGVHGVWMSVFHSISAFCNAGFDILGTKKQPFVSLMHYANSPVINIVIMSLIVIGGIGFLTWDDIYQHHLHFKKYRLQTKIVLMTTVLLITLPALFFYVYDFQNLGLKDGLLAAFFQSITTRTAGFNSVDLTKMSELSKAMMTVLMLIGASPSSTAGGMKITTFVILLTNCIAVFRQQEETDLFSRKIGMQVIRNAATIFIMYLFLCVFGAVLISLKDGFTLGECLFETASAVGTVGLTLGITTKLSCFSQNILIMLMFLGRVGGLTLIYATHKKTSKAYLKMPEEIVTVG